MNRTQELVIKKNQDEKRKLEEQLEQSSKIMRTSDACSSLVASIIDASEPFGTSGNPYTKKTGGSCIIL